MPEVVLQNVINTVQVQNETGETSKELPIGALASNVAFGGLQSTVSVEDKLKDHNTFIENLSTDDVKYIKNEVTQSLTDYLKKNITTDNKSTGIVEQEQNDDSAYVTAKGVIDYLAKKTNKEIKSTAEVANNNLVTDNAVFKYVKTIEDKLPIAAESLDDSENAKYVTVELFNSKYISMFEGELTDETDDITTLVNPNQVVTYVKSKTETGEIEENSNKLVTSGTLYTKFTELNIPSKAIGITSSTEDDSTYVTPLQVKNYIGIVVPTIFSTTNKETGEVTYNIKENVRDNRSYVSSEQVINYVYTKYVGTVEVTEEQVDTGKVDEESHPIYETVIKRTVTLTNLKDLTEEDERYTKGFVTPKQIIDYVKVAPDGITDETIDNTSFVTPLQVAQYVTTKLNVDTTLNFQDMTSMNAIAHSAVVKEFTYVRNFLGVSTFNQDGSYAGNTIPKQFGDILGKLDAISTRLEAVEKAVQIETTAG